MHRAQEIESTKSTFRPGRDIVTCGLQRTIGQPFRNGLDAMMESVNWEVKSGEQVKNNGENEPFCEVKNSKM